MVELEFLGAARTVTGSKILLTHENTRILIDCGLYQGRKELRLRNWEPLPINIDEISHIILTHAHIDHSGFLPRIYSGGYRKKILSTHITREVACVLLKDSGRLQEEEARYANKKGFSKHKLALPLYTEEDASRTLNFLKGFNYEENIDLNENISFKFIEAGHILGSAMISMEVKDKNKLIKIVFTGDMGREKAPIIKAPAVVDSADYLVLESTYGNKLHGKMPVEEELAEAIKEALKRKGVIIIPSFAVERTQELLYILEILKVKNIIPSIPVYIDSPMAVDITRIFRRHPEIYDEEALNFEKTIIASIERKEICFSEKVEESKALNEIKGGAIIISGSGMATGGRVLHHLRQRLPDERNTVFIVGYQAEGTRGKRLLNGELEIKIFGEYVPVRAKIRQIQGFSGHADYSEILQWLRNFKKLPQKIFLVHGEPDAMTFLSGKIKEEFNSDVYIPQYMEKITLNSQM